MTSRNIPQSFVLFLVLWSVLGLAANGNAQSLSLDEVLEEQREIWPLIFSEPDSAQQKINRLLPELDQFHDTLRAITLNHLAILRSNQGNPQAAAEAFQEAIDASHAVPERQMIFYRNLSLALKDFGEADAAFASLDKADSLAHVLGDNQSLNRCTCFRANLHYAIGNYEQATRHFLQCLDGFDLSDPKERISQAIEQQNLANVYSSTGDDEVAYELYAQSAEALRDAGRTYQFLQTLTNQIGTAIDLGRLEVADSLLPGALEQTKAFGIAELTLLLQTHSARLAHAQGDFEEAFRLSSRTLDSASASHSHIDFIRLHHQELLIADGRYLEAIAIADNHFAATGMARRLTINDLEMMRNRLLARHQKTPTNPTLSEAVDVISRLDSFQNALTSNRLAVLKGRYMLDQQRERNRELEERNFRLAEESARQDWRNFLLTILVISLLISSILAFLGFRWRSKSIAAELQASRSKTEALEQEKKLRKLQVEQTRSEMESRKRELVSVSLELAAVMSRLESLLEAESDAGTPEKYLKPFRTVLQAGDFLESFKMRFENLHPGFGKSLQEKFPELSPNDIEFCEFLKLGLSNKEIAQLLNISSNSALTRKYRIRKRMGLEEGERVEDHL